MTRARVLSDREIGRGPPRFRGKEATLTTAIGQIDFFIALAVIGKLRVGRLAGRRAGGPKLERMCELM
ncbi:hypothetical protein [Streptomyces sp. NBC_01233]|uniref:hypothetical protein n=1 Tax=Streptomyces sp. NBC_01233 TaxID=2903787 RepID=UPI002E14DEFC|nr:hypothetical protein OG332_23495 [Streptomyces sp. NBC_01233]